MAYIIEISITFTCLLTFALFFWARLAIAGREFGAKERA